MEWNVSEEEDVIVKREMTRLIVEWANTYEAAQSQFVMVGLGHSREKLDALRIRLFCLLREIKDYDRVVRGLV